MGLRNYLLKRVIIAIALFISVIIFNFFFRRLYQLPPADATWVDWFYHFIAYIQNMFTLQFGISFSTGNPVVEDIMERLPNTLLLMGTSMIFAVILGVVTG
ncbi:MAG: hypothetical protein ACXACH_05385, partial [Candidatus Hermodarchaeia archaeon]